MNAVHAVMAPVQTAITWALLHAVQLLGLIGLAPTQGATWFAAVALLVIAIRLVLVPLALRQIRAARAAAVMAPQLRALQARYRGRTDAESRRALAEESAALRREHGAGLLGCLPALLQAPIFYALFLVLRSVSQDHGIGRLEQTLVDQANSATLLGARLADTVLTAHTSSGHVVAVVVVVAAAVATLATQRRQHRLNTLPQEPGDPTATLSRVMVNVAPAMVVLSGLWLPLGVLTYWLVSNLCALAQQLVVIRYLPTPGTPAHARFIERRPTRPTVAPEAPSATEAGRTGRQRAQPVGRARARRRTRR